MGKLPGRSQVGRPSPWLTAPVAAAIAAVLTGGLAALVGVLVSLHSHPDPLWLWLAVQPVGASFTAAGVIAWLRRPSNRSGLLMVVVGITWYLVDLRGSAQPVWFALGFCMFYLSPVAFTHLVLALPTGRLPGRAERAVAISLYVVSVGNMVLRYVSERPRGPQSWASSTAGYSPWVTVGSAAGLALTLAAIGLVVRRWRAASRPTRRTHALVWTTGAVIGLIVLGTILASLLDASVARQRQLGLLYLLVLVVTPFAILAGVLRVRMARMRVADLVMRLEASPEPLHLRDAIADALGDPTLQVCFRLPATRDTPGGYVDADGHPLPPPVLTPAAPHGSSGRAVTLVERQGEQLAALVHDPALNEPSPRPTPSGTASSATCTTVRSISCSLSRSWSARPATSCPAVTAAPAPGRLRCSTRPPGNCTTSSTSCASSPRGSTRPPSPNRGSQRRSRRSPSARPCRSAARSQRAAGLSGSSGPPTS